MRLTEFSTQVSLPGVTLLAAIVLSSSELIGHRCPTRPAQFGGGGAWVGAEFPGGGANHIVRDLGIKAVAVASLECFLYPPIFARVKGEHGHASAGFEALRQLAQQGVEGGEL